MADDMTPAQLGYRFPAEWEPHAATWLAWPHAVETWPGKFAPVPPLFAELVRTLARFEPVHVLAGGAEVMEQARSFLGGVPNVTLHDVPTDDAWIRDHGPLFLAGGPEPALVDWEYNAWGGKYPPFDADNAVPGRVAEILRCRRFRPGVVLEGGALDANGRGTLLASRTCLLNPNRNPNVTQPDFERLLADHCAARHVIWLDGELAGDDTDGHVDQLARFVCPSTVLVAAEADPAEANHAPLAACRRQLEAARDQDGNRLEVLPLRLPRPVFFHGQRLPASYVNFYVANGAVLVPQFRDPADAPALERLTEAFPDREVLGVDSLDLVLGLGSLHCVTQQQPF